MILPEKVRMVCDAVKSVGGTAFVVGGAVRDHVLGIEPKDFDIEVYGIPMLHGLIDLLKSLGLELDLVGESFGVIKIKGEEIDISIPRRDSKTGSGHKGFTIEGDPFMTPTEAASRRDFTINSLAYSPYSDNIIDPFGGVSDLKNKILRHTSDKFVEDPLRVLRGMQFIARFDLTPDPMTVQLCRGLNSNELARERIYDEWVKLITKGVKISKGLDFLKVTGWINDYPELADLIGVQQDPEWHPEGDVFVHTGLCMDAFASTRGEEDQYDQLVCGFAVLCHDLGKATETIFKDGRWRSPRHEIKGEDPTKSFLSRMIESETQRKSSSLIDDVIPLVTNHMAPSQFAQVGASDSAIRRLSARVSRIDWLTWVSVCDKMGRGSQPYDSSKEDWLRNRARQIKVLDSKPKAIIMGRHLVDKGYDPGPVFTLILDLAYEAQLNGDFSDEPSGLEWLKNAPLEEELGVKEN